MLIRISYLLLFGDVRHKRGTAIMIDRSSYEATKGKLPPTKINYRQRDPNFENRNLKGTLKYNLKSNCKIEIEKEFKFL